MCGWMGWLVGGWVGGWGRCIRDAILPTFSEFSDFSSVQCENEIIFSLF